MTSLTIFKTPSFLLDICSIIFDFNKTNLSYVFFHLERRSDQEIVFLTKKCHGSISMYLPYSPSVFPPQKIIGKGSRCLWVGNTPELGSFPIRKHFELFPVVPDFFRVSGKRVRQEYGVGPHPLPPIFPRSLILNVQH